MRAKIFNWVLATFLLTTASVAEAQQIKKIPRIGYLTTGPGETQYQQSFRQGLRELGYVEGKNIIIEYRYAEGRLERTPELAEELVRLKVDLVLAGNATSARAAKKATATIPIVVANAGDPIGSGLVASLARPDGNVTGLTNSSPELLGKRLELLKEVVPKVSRFGFLNDADSRASRQMFTDMQTAAESLGVNIQLIEVKASNPDLEAAFKVLVKKGIGALLTAPGPRIGLHRTRILELLEHNRIAAMHPAPDWSSGGGLMSYGANVFELYRHSAVYVDKILKGAKPADLPVEQPRKFEFVINLKTAKALNLTIAQSVLYRADRVIK
jgi:ABC-type uncharacterized transport system substrate-binding protein